MQTTGHTSFFRNAAVALLASTFLTGLTGCNDDDAVTNPNTVLTSATYSVELVPGKMESAMGKSQFQVTVTNSTTKAAVTAETVKLMPMMHMNSGKNHATPVDNKGVCTETLTLGTYDCTVFYVMADVDATGASTGEWDLKVMIGGMNGESVTFKPSVGMSMGGPAMAKLRHESLAMGTMVRTFQVFKSSLTGTTGDHTFELFTSTMEDMMKFPAVYPTVVLNADGMMPLTINSMAVRVSTQSDFGSDVHDATSNAKGYWTATGITGLVDDKESTLYVEVSINGNVLNNSIDGKALAATSTTPATEEYASFTVTP